CDISYEQSQKLYKDTDQNLKVEVVIHLCNISKSEASKRLQRNDNIIKKAIKD
ncbi:N-acetylmuramic acid 6-phosphate etherase, partial [Staphylococcus shinii]